jgi:hypothetical protein
MGAYLFHLWNVPVKGQKVYYVRFNYAMPGGILEVKIAN